MKKWLILASVMCLAFVIAACGAGNSSNTPADNTSAADPSEATSELVIQASNWKFDKDEYKIKAGETVNLKVDSIDGVHAIQILKTKYNVKNNQTLAVKFAEPGTYTIICSQPCGTGHSKMKATLIVE